VLRRQVSRLYRQGGAVLLRQSLHQLGQRAAGLGLLVGLLGLLLGLGLLVGLLLVGLMMVVLARPLGCAWMKAGAPLPPLLWQLRLPPL
jgi:hypothetical protein